MNKDLALLNIIVNLLDVNLLEENEKNIIVLLDALLAVHLNKELDFAICFELSVED